MPSSSVVAVDPYPPWSVFLLAFLCFRRRAGKRTTPSSDTESNPPPHRFSYSLLRTATESFSNRVGHGGFGPVFSGLLPPAQKPIAVKLMDAAAAQGEREFNNELFFASKLRSEHVVVPIGFASDRTRRRFLLVYELMPNGNLQDALLRRKCPELMNWKKRFGVIIDIARGIQYLHSCDPPVIHGDIKPSNILLDSSFSAKIGDYGLAQLKSESQNTENGGVIGIDDCETESANTGIPISETEASPSKLKKKLRSKSVRDWWWGKQEEEDETEISEIKKKKTKKEIEWWREEHCEKLSKKKKKKNKKGFNSEDEESWQNERKNSKRRNSMDWWFDGLNRNNSQDSLTGEIKSNGISSTPSMRGTVCYIAPEFNNNNNGGEITEKCDVYGFGVLLLVIVAGRRPLEVVNGGSPLSELQRGNLLYWARHCARNGKLTELVDRRLVLTMKEKEEALLCIKVALLCVVKSPSKRPSMEEVVRMLCGEAEQPQLPAEYSPSWSPPVATLFPFKSRKNDE